MIKEVIDNQTIVWVCSQCAEEIPVEHIGEDGYSDGHYPAGLIMSVREMYRAQESEDGWNQFNKETDRLTREQGKSYVATNIAEMMLATKNLQIGYWAAYCKKCIVDKEDVYFIEISRIDTVMDFLSWTIHIKKKEWVSHTNWDDIAQELLSVGGCKN
jgi:hypothetical protein